MLSNFCKLWPEGIGRLAAVYAVSLFGFVSWMGLAISWLFFGGITLIPIEKKLVAWSLGLGIALLIALAAINHFFPLAM